MDDRCFYVTLPCNASLSVYPENRISSYTTRLAKTINLKGEWQVGLAEIEYPRSWYSFNVDNGVFSLHVYPVPSQKHANKPGEDVFKKLPGMSIARNLQIAKGTMKMFVP